MIIYAICLVVGLLFTILSAIVGHFFGGHDGTDVGTGGHAEAGFDQRAVCRAFRFSARQCWRVSSRHSAHSG
jgi:hypothetical protein